MVVPNAVSTPNMSLEWIRSRVLDVWMRQHFSTEYTLNKWHAIPLSSYLVKVCPGVGSLLGLLLIPNNIDPGCTVPFMLVPPVEELLIVGVAIRDKLIRPSLVGSLGGLLCEHLWTVVDRGMHLVKFNIFFVRKDHPHGTSRWGRLGRSMLIV
jgi:hypothetical protein